MLSMKTCPVCGLIVEGKTIDDSIDKTLGHIASEHPEYAQIQERKCPYCQEIVKGVGHTHAERLLANHINEHKNKNILDHAASMSAHSLEVQYAQLYKQNEDLLVLVRKMENLLVLASGVLLLNNESVGVVNEINVFLEEHFGAKHE